MKTAPVINQEIRTSGLQNLLAQKSLNLKKIETKDLSSPMIKNDNESETEQTSGRSTGENSGRETGENNGTSGRGSVSGRNETGSVSSGGGGMLGELQNKLKNRPPTTKVEDKPQTTKKETEQQDFRNLLSGRVGSKVGTKVDDKSQPKTETEQQDFRNRIGSTKGGKVGSKVEANREDLDQLKQDFFKYFDFKVEELIEKLST